MSKHPTETPPGTRPAAAPESSIETRTVRAALDSDTRAHVEFEAAWQCDLTRFAFDDLSEVDTMRTEQLESYGITEDAHEDFVARLDTEPDLAEIVAELSGDCTGTDTDIDGPVEL